MEGTATKRENVYHIDYTGSLQPQMSNSTVSVIVESLEFKQAIRNIKTTNLKVKSQKNGNLLTWKNSASNYKADYTVTYRSLKQSKGYSSVGIVKGSAKSFLDDSGITKGKSYYYRVRFFHNYIVARSFQDILKSKNVRQRPHIKQKHGRKRIEGC